MKEFIKGMLSTYNFCAKARVGKFSYISNVIEIETKILFRVLFKLQTKSDGVNGAF